MEEFNDPREELKRADHLIYITLKYTRTSDVMKNVIKRLSNSCEYAIDEALQYAKDISLIKTVPKSYQEKAELLKKVMPNKRELKKHVEFCSLLKKINESRYKVREEYRKNVTLIIDDRESIEINMEGLKEFYAKTEDFVGFVKDWVAG